ncbi:MAG: hypothetical protein ACI8XO_001652 [Verrucomicrobiales bacterium]|jgi:hypothetical protein
MRNEQKSANSDQEPGFLKLWRWKCDFSAASIAEENLKTFRRARNFQRLIFQTIRLNRIALHGTNPAKTLVQQAVYGYAAPPFNRFSLLKPQNRPEDPNDV